MFQSEKVYLYILRKCCTMPRPVGGELHPKILKIIFLMCKILSQNPKLPPSYIKTFSLSLLISIAYYNEI